jgi:hypothetical protein
MVRPDACNPLQTLGLLNIMQLIAKDQVAPDGFSLRKRNAVASIFDFLLGGKRRYWISPDGRLVMDLGGDLWCSFHRRWPADYCLAMALGSTATVADVEFAIN